MNILRSVLLFGLVTCVLHAQSNSPFVSSPWCGSTSITSTTIAVHLVSSGLKVRLAVSIDQDLNRSIYTESVTSSITTNNIVKLTAQGLLPNTDYYYGFEINGVLRTENNSRGHFRTFPLGAGSFKIAFASCGDFRVPSQSAYDAIVAEQPLMFINTGDLHYIDTNSTNISDYYRNYDSVLQHPNQSAVYRNMSMAYIWDDHDFCGNDSDGTAVGRDTARRAYNEFVPHYPYAINSGPIAQAFTIGRVRVIITDLRSAASPHDQLDNADKTHMGQEQKAWFKQELINARDADCPMILWVSSTPWIGREESGDDDWSVYAYERREIANFIKANHIKNLTLLCGDMHALAFDDGSHSDYANGGGAPLIVLHAAALTAEGSVKGGPYTAGPFPGNQQYGILEVTDNGGSNVSCTFSGKRVGTGTLISYTFTGQASKQNQTTDGRSLTAISTRTLINGNDVAILGFVIGGQTPRTVAIRAVGPTLANYGVPDFLPDPKLRLHIGKNEFVDNDNWGTGNVLQVTNAFNRAGLGSFPSNSNDSSIIITLPPGVYTAEVRSVDGASGVVLVEVYDIP